MAIPDLERRRVVAMFTKFCDRVPAQARHQLAYDFTIRGNAVTVLERRPHFQDPKLETQHPFARFVFDPTSHTWSLRWRDRNIRWHLYEGFAGMRQLSDLIAEVERDPTHIFFG